MDRKRLLERRERLQRQRDAALRRCRARWRIRINAVNRVLRAPGAARDITSRASQGRISPVAVWADAHERKVKRNGKQCVMEVVRQTLRRNQGFFTARTLVRFINQTKTFSITERGILNPLRRLSRLGEIKLVEKGRGRKPHMYAKL